MFVGYHCGIGTLHGVLDHTYAGAAISQMKLNGVVVNEAIINALIAGQHCVPVGMISGDEQFCLQTATVLKNVRAATVKWAVSRYAARSMHPAKACELIRRKAKESVREFKKFKPLKMKPPYNLEVRMHNTGMADKCEIIPGAGRTDAFTITYTSHTVPDIFKAMLCIVEMACYSIPQVRHK
jgi:D-amino peptidase